MILPIFFLKSLLLSFFISFCFFAFGSELLVLNFLAISQSSEPFTLFKPFRDSSKKISVAKQSWELRIKRSGRRKIITCLLVCGGRCFCFAASLLCPTIFNALYFNFLGRCLQGLSHDIGVVKFQTTFSWLSYSSICLFQIGVCGI